MQRECSTKSDDALNCALPMLTPLRAAGPTMPVGKK